MPEAVDAALTTFVHEQMPFTEGLGLEVLRGEPTEVVARAAWAPERCTAAATLHGGFLMAVADSVGAMCAVLNLPAGATTATIESKTNFMRAVKSGTVTISCSPIHVGRTSIVLQTDIVRDDDGALVTRTLQTQAVIAPRPAGSKS